MTIIDHTKLDRLLQQLEQSGRRVTPQRAAVCGALVAHGGHPTPHEVYEAVRASNPAISQATVYNTVAVLAELGLIRKLDLAHDEHAHYDLDTRPHVNVICTRCGQVVDVHTDTLEALLGIVAARSGYVLDGQGVVVHGLCPSCRLSQHW